MILFSDAEIDIRNFTVEITEDMLKETVYRTFEVGEVYPEIEILEYVESKYDPEDVFSYNELSDWAKANEKTIKFKRNPIKKETS